MKRLRSILFDFILILLVAACSKAPATWDEHYDLGMRYLTDGNYEEAILSFTAAIEIDAKRIEAYIGRGDAYFAFEELEDHFISAIADFEAVLGLDEQNVDAYLRLADVYVALDDKTAVIDILYKGYEATSDETVKQKLNEYISDESVDAAVEYFNLTVKDDPKDVDAYIFLADIYHEQDMISEEYEALVEASKTEERPEVVERIEERLAELEIIKEQQEAEKAAEESSQGEFFQTIMGCTYTIPAEFESIDIGGTPGWMYCYRNEELDMAIDISEIAFAKIGFDEPPKEIMMRDYQNILDSSVYEITYHTANDSFYVVSGYRNGDRIFYVKDFNVLDGVRVSVEFEYPKENKELCDKILTDFLNGFSVGE